MGPLSDPQGASVSPPAIRAPASLTFTNQVFDTGDAVALLQLIAALQIKRVGEQSWRKDLLDRIIALLAASSAAALILRGNTIKPPTVLSLFDRGFKSAEQRQAFWREFQTKPLQDPHSRLAWDYLLSRGLDTFTCLRSDFVDDATWYNDGHVLTYRRPSHVDDCLLSFHRGTGNCIYALYAFRPFVNKVDEGATTAGIDLTASGRFRARDRLLLDTLHRGLGSLYRSELSAQALRCASELPPRLRQALDLLLSNKTERQAAKTMSISIHTFHDYVKILYLRFGVSRRSELRTRWNDSTREDRPAETVPSQIPTAIRVR